MEFMCGDSVRMGFGFCNPNHAAAFICAAMPFLWGWRRWRAFSVVASIGLLAMLAMTYSRTGFAVLAFEAVAWAALTRRVKWLHVLSAVAVFAVLAVWLSPRFSLDGAVLNRPKIWLAGFELVAANPFGVGLGHSGAVATAFLLPEGIEVRTLVNSHLSLAAEFGLPVFAVYLAFVSAALIGGVRLARTWISFASLVVSACVSSAFDWHVLFGVFGGTAANAVLSWLLFAVFIASGAVLAAQCRSVRRLSLAAGCAVLPCAIMLFAPVPAGAPKVSDGFVWHGKPNGLAVFYDSTWSLVAVSKIAPEGTRIAIESGVADGVSPAEGEDVLLIGYAAESRGRFTGHKIAYMYPPDYLEGS